MSLDPNNNAHLAIQVLFNEILKAAASYQHSWVTRREIEIALGIDELATTHEGSSGKQWLNHFLDALVAMGSLEKDRLHGHSTNVYCVPDGSL